MQELPSTQTAARRRSERTAIKLVFNTLFVISRDLYSDYHTFMPQNVQLLSSTKCTVAIIQSVRLLSCTKCTIALSGRRATLSE